MSSLLKGLEKKIEQAVQERMGPILAEMKNMNEELRKINENLEKIIKLLKRSNK